MKADKTRHETRHGTQTRKEESHVETGYIRHKSTRRRRPLSRRRLCFPPTGKPNVLPERVHNCFFVFTRRDGGLNEICTTGTLLAQDLYRILKYAHSNLTPTGQSRVSIGRRAPPRISGADPDDEKGN